MSLSAQESAIVAAIDGQAARLARISDAIHDFNELGYEEHRSSALLVSELEALGLRVTTGAGGLATAFVAELAGAKAGPTTAVLAEYDALPGLGHACGHNVIGAAALGAAVGLAAVRGELPGTVRIVGTPAEEGFKPNAGGKVVMFEAGVFEDVDAAMIVHPGEPFTAGGTSLARDNFRLTFRGRRPGVGAPRWDAVDSQDGLMLTHAAINVLRQHVPPSVVIQWLIEKGGDNPNIIPIESVARLYVRAPRMDTVRAIVARIMDCARGAAAAVGGEVEYDRHANLYDEVVPNPTLNGLFLAALRDAGVPEQEIAAVSPGQVTHSDDTGIISKHIPTISGRIIVGPPGLVLHTKEATIATRSPAAHRGLVVGAKCMALTAWRLAADPALLAAARADLAAARADLGSHPGVGLDA
ncbi:MAG: amidohydrolase [Bacillota bacterium]|nr:amidohydrolase [Bacillota bacterium]